MNNNADLIEGLRELATFLEERPEFPVIDAASAEISWNVKDKEGIAAAMRALEKCEKLPEAYSGDCRFRIRRLFGPVALVAWVFRNYICKKIKKMQEVEVWECPESILAPEQTQEVASAQ